MNILQFGINQVQAFVDQGVMRSENLVHWEVCRSLAAGKTIENVADDFRMHTNNIIYIKKKKCPDCKNVQ